MVSKSNALHFAGVGLKDTETGHEGYTYPGIFVKFTDFAGNKEIENEEDEGHTGRRTLKLGSVRNKASASPEITDNFRLNQGLEDFCYHALGTMTETSNEATEEVGANYVQTITPNTTGDLPQTHILHGFNDDVQGCRIYKNALANELTFTMNSEEKPTVKCAYISDFPIFGEDTQTVSPTFGAYAPKALNSGNFAVFFAPKSTTIDEATDKIDCLTDSEVTVNNNIEASICAGTEFGESNKDIKNLEVTGNMTLRYADKDIERLFATNTYDGVKVSEKSLEGALRFKYVSEYIPTGETKPIPLLFQIDIPNATIDKAESSESGDDVKTISIEFSSSDELSELSTPIIKITTQSGLQFMTSNKVTTHVCLEMPT